MTENSDKTYERGATLHSECACCEHAAEEIERLSKVVSDLLSLGQIPAEDVARHFVEGELRIAGPGMPPMMTRQTITRLAEVIRRARLDGANAATREAILALGLCQTALQTAMEGRGYSGLELQALTAVKSFLDKHETQS